MAYSKEEAVKLIISTGLELVRNGLIVGTWGNISARISDTQFVITPRDRGFEALNESDLVTVNISDYSYEGDILPSGEKDLHGGVYKNRPDVNFIIHTHQLYGTAYGSTGQALTGYSDADEQILGKKAVCISYAPSCSKRLAEAMAGAAKDNPECFGFFMMYHGVLCLGRDYKHSLSVSTALEDICMQKVTGRLKFALEGKKGADIYISEDIAAKFPGRRVMFVTSPAIVAVSEKFLKLRPTIDDLAQIGGVNINCIDYDEDFEYAIKRAVGRNSVALIRKYGALVVAGSYEECEAIGIILDKNCTALLFEMVMGPEHHLKLFDAMAQRRKYVSKHSRLKGAYAAKPEAANKNADEKEADIKEKEPDVMEDSDDRKDNES